MLNTELAFNFCAFFRSYNPETSGTCHQTLDVPFHTFYLHRFYFDIRESFCAFPEVFHFDRNAIFVSIKSKASSISLRVADLFFSAGKRENSKKRMYNVFFLNHSLDKHLAHNLVFYEVWISLQMLDSIIMTCSIYD